MSKKRQQIVFSFGSSIRYAREKRDYTREQIADRAEISSRFLAAIENNKRKPSLDVLIRLVNAIGASFDEILAPQMERGSETFLAPSDPMVYPSMVVFTAIVPSV